MAKQVRRVERHIGGRGAKIAATAIIWPSAVAMLAICIPIVKAVKSEFVPIAVVLGATGSTAMVWFSPHTMASGKTESHFAPSEGFEGQGWPEDYGATHKVQQQALSTELSMENISPVLPLW